MKEFILIAERLILFYYGQHLFLYNRTFSFHQKNPVTSRGLLRHISIEKLKNIIKTQGIRLVKKCLLFVSMVTVLHLSTIQAANTVKEQNNKIIVSGLIENKPEKTLLISKNKNTYIIKDKIEVLRSLHGQTVKLSATLHERKKGKVLSEVVLLKKVEAAKKNTPLKPVEAPDTESSNDYETDF